MNQQCRFQPVMKVTLLSLAVVVALATDTFGHGQVWYSATPASWNGYVVSGDAPGQTLVLRCLDYSQVTWNITVHYTSADGGASSWALDHYSYNTNNMNVSNLNVVSQGFPDDIHYGYYGFGGLLCDQFGGNYSPGGAAPGDYIVETFNLNIQNLSGEAFVYAGIGSYEFRGDDPDDGICGCYEVIQIGPNEYRPGYPLCSCEPQCAEPLPVIQILPYYQPHTGYSCPDCDVPTEDGVWETSAQCEAACHIVPIEGGVRAKIDSIPVPIASPTVTVGGMQLGSNDFYFYENSAGGQTLYFTPPPHAEGLASVVITSAVIGDPYVVPNFALQYTTDILQGVQATRKGVETYYQEQLEHFGSTFTNFATRAPKGGAIAEVILHGILRRAPVGAGSEGSPLTGVLEQFLPSLRSFTANFIASHLSGFGGTLAIRPITHGQTTHYLFRHVDDTVLLTMGNGTLTLTNVGMQANDEAAAGGSFILPNDIGPNGGGWSVTPAEAQGWQFNVEVHANDGVHIVDGMATRPQIGLQYVFPRLSVPALHLGNQLDCFQLKLEDLSHIYVKNNISATMPQAPPFNPTILNEWILTAMYRSNLDRSPQQDNVAKPALVMRQSYAFSSPHTDYEPTHCLRAAHAYPRMTFSLSVPGNPPGLPNLSQVQCDHRLEFAPQRGYNPFSPDEYVAGLFRDKDEIQKWIIIEGTKGPCQPWPVWANLFQPEHTQAPVECSITFASHDHPPVAGVSDIVPDNVHLHHVHPDTVNLFSPDHGFGGAIVEAPGSFNGTIHIHWRWGAAFGQEFGAGQHLMPDGQHWLMTLNNPSFPPYPSYYPYPCPNLTASAGDEVAGANAGDCDYILLEEKVLDVYCLQGGTQWDRQYETLSTGFTFAIGVPDEDPCPMIEYKTRTGGYWLGTLGFGTPLTDGPLWNLGSWIPFAGSLWIPYIGIFDVCPHGGHLTETSQQVSSGTALCCDVGFAEELLTQSTPLGHQVCGTDVTFAAMPESGRFRVQQNLFTSAIGYILSETEGAGGSTLVIDFNPPVRMVRHLPVVVNDVVGSATLTVTAFLNQIPLGTLSATATIRDGAPYAEGFVAVDPGQLFDQLTIVSDDPTKEFGISHFQICNDVIASGDLDYNGVIDANDFTTGVARCMAGPDVVLGFDCADPDLDGDGDIDLLDVSVFQRLLSSSEGAAPTISVQLESPSAGTTVAPGAQVTWSINVSVPQSNNLGLALISADLTQDPSNPATFDIPPGQATSIDPTMEQFNRPLGISNPGEGGALTGYIGVQRGITGGRNLVQIGGGQNTFGAPGPAGIGQDYTVNPGVGQGATPQLVLSGTFSAPSTNGTYIFHLTNVFANVLTTIGAPPAHSSVTPAMMDLTAANFSFAVGTPCVAGEDCNANGISDTCDIASGTSFDCNQNGVPDECEGEGELNFAAASSFPAGNSPYSVIAALLDGDGDQDFVVANLSSDTVSVLRNNGNGTFLAPTSYAVGPEPYSVVAADFNGDGKQDLAVANVNSNNAYSKDVSVLLNHGDGTFAAAVNYEAGYVSKSIISADLDRDGHRDLVVANQVSSNVSVLRNHGDGTFETAVNYLVAGQPMSLATADLDGDGDPDLAVASSNRVAVLRNNGNGTFAATVSYYWVGDYPMCVTIADLDGDGNQDLAVANQGSNDVSGLLNNGDGTFAAAVNYTVGPDHHHLYSITSADLDRDGYRELVVAGLNFNGVSILPNNGNGTFSAAVHYSVGTGPDSVIATDLDGDGDPDLVAANVFSNDLSVLRNDTIPPAPDCNANGIPDACDIGGGTSSDINNNAVPDECEIRRGDLNCDDSINNLDIDPFVMALVNPPVYAVAHSGCLISNGDINGDGLVNGRDISGFVACVLAGGCL